MSNKTLNQFSRLEEARRKVVNAAKDYYETFTFRDGTFDDNNQEVLEKKTDKLIYAVEELAKAEAVVRKTG